MLLARMLRLVLVALLTSACGGASCLLQSHASVVIDTQMAGDGSSGMFTLSGGCDICAEGSVTNLDSGFGDEYFIVDEMVCADESGSFVVKTQSDAAGSGGQRTGSVGEWEVVSGTGNYTELSGDGDYQSSFDEPCCSETYSGVMDRQDG